MRAIVEHAQTADEKCEREMRKCGSATSESGGGWGTELFSGTQWKSVRVVPRLDAMAIFGSEYIEVRAP